MTIPTENTTPSEPARGVSKIVPWIIALLVTGGVAYGVGRMQGAGAIEKAREETAGAQKAVEAAQAQVEAGKTLNRQLEARRQLHRALIALDQRNFGIAQNYLSATSILLGNVGGDLAALGQDLRKVNLVATSDLAVQRNQIIGFVERMDAALPSWEGNTAHGAPTAPGQSPHGAPGMSAMPPQ